jgi:acyl carrier protein
MWDDRFPEVLRAAVPGLRDQAVTADTCLRAAGLDSLATIELLLLLEDTYGVSVPDHMLTGATFATPASLWQTLDGLRTASTAS